MAAAICRNRYETDGAADDGVWGGAWVTGVSWRQYSVVIIATDTAGNVPGLAILLPQLSVITEFILAHRAGADKLEAQR